MDLGNYILNSEIETKVDRLLNFDPLYVNEQLGGSKESALGLFGTYVDQKEKMAHYLEDNRFGGKPWEFVNLAENLGFEYLHESLFVDDEWERQSEEMYYILWHPKYSILLTMETFGGQNAVNMAKFYANWKPFVFTHHTIHVHYSGGFINKYKAPKHEVEYCIQNHIYNRVGCNGDWIWPILEMSVDCREFLKYNIIKLLRYGTFERLWLQVPFLWLGNYVEHKTQDSFDLNIKYLREFPEEVKMMLIPKSSRYYKHIW